MDQTENGGGVELLLALSAAGPDALAELDRAVQRLHEVQAAKAALAQMPSEDVRQAIARRNHLLGEVRGA